jgi:hypothetical protein
MSAAGEHKQLFKNLLADKFPVKPNKKKKRAAEEDLSSSSSGDDSDSSSGGNRRKRRSHPAHQPLCQFCGGAHWQAQCRKFQQAIGQAKGEGYGRDNGNNHNGRGGGGSGNRGPPKQNSGA